MISSDALRQISSIFCGDISGFYSYKTGPRLVEFFNQYYNASDIYKQGFPSRWSYVYDKLLYMLKNHMLDSFFDIILNNDYLVKDLDLTIVQAAAKVKEIFGELNSIVQKDACKIIHNSSGYHLIRENDDLILIGSGGFANVYHQKSTGLVIKKLKDDFLTDVGILSRFKREFNITKSLQKSQGIIKVYNFDEGNCSYSMELADITLEKYVLNNNLSENIKVRCIRQILNIMTEVHKCDIIHRDISPNNIFIIADKLKIADFGLGKDLNVFTSHQTINTKAIGQYSYCAPEQFMLLKDGNKQSDVYSLGRVINFVMTCDPRNSHHIFGNIAEKATNESIAYRYADAGQLLTFFEKAVLYCLKEKNDERINLKIKKKIFDEEVESYIYSLNSEKIATAVYVQNNGFSDALFSFMHLNDEHARYIIECINNSYQDVCGRTFSSYDPFAYFSYCVLKDNFSFIIKETAANILRFVAFNVGRYDAQGLIKDIKSIGVEPMLEEILN